MQPPFQRTNARVNRGSVLESVTAEVTLIAHVVRSLWLRTQNLRDFSAYCPRLLAGHAPR